MITGVISVLQGDVTSEKRPYYVRRYGRDGLIGLYKMDAFRYI